MRESLFAWLGDCAGARVLDLFAGSGALGMEALSRGAARAVFVERSAGAAAALRANLRALELEDSARVLRSPARAALRRLAREGARFELALLDPPYGSGEVAPALEALTAGDLLAPGATVVVESERRHPPGEVAGLAPAGERRYGETLLRRFVRTGGSDPPPGAPGASGGPEAG